MSYQRYKAWLDAANAAADMPDFHKAVKAEIRGLIEDGAIGWQQSDIAATAICYADHCLAPLKPQTRHNRSQRPLRGLLLARWPSA